MFEKAIEIIKKYETVIIHRHKNPDGDAIGSQIGLKHMLTDSFPDKKIYAVGDSSKTYAFLSEAPMDNPEDSVWEGALAIILDTSSSALISDERYKKAAERLRIDHHIFCEKIAETEIVDTSYESCAGLVTELAIEHPLKVSKDAASALFTGTVTDSGRFRYDTTTGGTFRRVSFLMEKGINISEIYRKLYTVEIKSLKLKGFFIDRMRFTKNNVGYIYTSRSELKKLEISAFTASRAYVNTMADIEGVNIWVAFAEDNEGVLCELRSADRNINPIAVKYGGGGHAKASGATVKDKAQAMAMLEDLDRLAGEK